MVVAPPTTPVAGAIDKALANGRALLRQKPAVALDQAHAILQVTQGHPAALRLAAAAHRALGQRPAAEAAELAAIHHSQRDPKLIAAVRALDAKDPGEASRLAAEQLQSVPDDLAALTISAEAALAFGLAHRAEPLLRQVLDRAPGFATARNYLVNALQLQDKLTEALAVLEPLIKFAPGDVAALALKARLNTDLGRYEEAAAIYEQLLKANDADVSLWVPYGDSLRFIGRKADSELAYRRALALDPHHGQAWWSLVDLDVDAIGDSDFAAIREALVARRDEPEHAGNLYFALGALFDRRGDRDQAFAHIASGNALRRKAQPYSALELTEQVDTALNLARQNGLPARSRPRPSRFTPIFIVGMPRSGSTLVERVLGRHSQIEAAGELAIMPHIVERLKRDRPDDRVERAIATLSAGELEEIGQLYRERAAEHRRTERPFLIDKLHMNWRHLPLILRAIPEARVIDIRRLALDCCWSNYRLLFARGHPAASDLADLGHFYRDYVRLTDGLREVAPDAILAVRYEAVVEDLEAETRRLLDFLGLTFEPGCLDFHLSAQPVATASSEQVRRPINREGIGSAAPYAPWLGPLREALGDLAN